MQFTRFLPLALIPLLAACEPAGGPGPKPKGHIELTANQKVAIGRKIWKNECGGTVNGRTTWKREPLDRAIATTVDAVRKRYRGKGKSEQKPQTQHPCRKKLA